MQTGDSAQASGRLTCASFLDALPTPEPWPINVSKRRGDTQSPHEFRAHQTVSIGLVDEDDEDDYSIHHSPPSASPSPIPAAPDLSSSPAALFLSAFMSPKVDPKPVPDDEGSQVGGYTLGPVVGFGGFSTIRKAFSTSGGAVAIKIIRRADLVRTGHAAIERKKLEHEASIWAGLSHEHILPLFSAVHTSYADYFITLYCPAGSLYDILKRDGSPALPQDDAGMMFRQVVRGLRYLHEDAMLVHRDMKLENVLVDESGVCRIGDFGLSVKIGQVQDDEDALWEDEQDQHDASGYNTVHRAFSLSLPKRPGRIGSTLNPVSRHHSARHRSTPSSTPTNMSQPGSLPYAAPEILVPQSTERALPHPGQDIWALGIMLYALLSGHLPFNDSFEPRLQMKILNSTFDVPKDIGRGAERILHGCLERNMVKRWSIAMVDDVAWGVGWGSAGDGATPEEEDGECEDEPVPEPELSPTSVDSIMSDNEEDWEHEEMIPRSAMEAATRRSTSRVQRSLSRAPIPTRTQNGRSMSRPSRASSPPRTGSLNTSFFHQGLNSTHSPMPSPYFETPSRSRSASRPRGRRPKKSRSLLPSRSPSPSVVPTTPVDIGSHILARMHLEDHPEELELDPPARGRSMFASGYQDQSDEYDAGPEDEKPSLPPLMGSMAGQWVPSFVPGYRQEDGSRSISSDESFRDRSIDAESSTSRRAMSQIEIENDDTLRPSRAGSTPPGPSESWDVLRTKMTREGILIPRRQSSDLLMGTFSGITSPNPGMTSRSRSAEDTRLLSLEIATNASIMGSTTDI